MANKEGKQRTLTLERSVIVTLEEIKIFVIPSGRIRWYVCTCVERDTLSRDIA